MKYVDSLVQTYIGLSIKEVDNTVIAESAQSGARDPLKVVRISGPSGHFFPDCPASGKCKL